MQLLAVTTFFPFCHLDISNLFYAFLGHHIILYLNIKFSYDLFLTTQRETIQECKGPFIKVSYRGNLNNLEETQHLIVDSAAIARSMVFSAAESRGFQQKFQT